MLVFGDQNAERMTFKSYTFAIHGREARTAIADHDVARFLRECRGERKCIVIVLGHNDLHKCRSTECKKVAVDILTSLRQLVDKIREVNNTVRIVVSDLWCRKREDASIRKTRLFLNSMLDFQSAEVLRTRMKGNQVLGTGYCLTRMGGMRFEKALVETPRRGTVSVV